MRGTLVMAGDVIDSTVATSGGCITLVDCVFEGAELVTYGRAIVERVEVQVTLVVADG